VDDDQPLTCRDLDELEDADCCAPCHRDTARGLDRLRVVELEDGRSARVCHSAFAALRDAGLLTAAREMDAPHPSRGEP
jgi:hypothetical protein